MGYPKGTICEAANEVVNSEEGQEVLKQIGIRRVTEEEILPQTRGIYAHWKRKRKEVALHSLLIERYARKDGKVIYLTKKGLRKLRENMWP